MNEITFTDIEVPAGAPLKGKVTGIPRRIKDSCADFYNSIQKWNSLCIQGVPVLRKIVDCKLLARNLEEQNGNNEDNSCKIFQDRTVHMKELQDHCMNLEEIVEAMEEIVSAMSLIVDRLQAVSELSFQQSSSFDTVSDGVFQTWPADKFYTTTKTILQMYKNEIILKKDILGEISLLKDQKQMEFFIVAWSHEPYVKCEANELLEAIVTETGFKIS